MEPYCEAVRRPSLEKNEPRLRGGAGVGGDDLVGLSGIVAACEGTRLLYDLVHETSCRDSCCQTRELASTLFCLSLRRLWLVCWTRYKRVDRWTLHLGREYYRWSILKHAVRSLLLLRRCPPCVMSPGHKVVGRQKSRFSSPTNLQDITARKDADNNGAAR